MEELLNAIDRFLGMRNFEGRVLSDAEEFHELLTECRGLYPEALPERDRPSFDETIDQTTALAERLCDSISKGDTTTARELLSRLGEQRQHAHSRYSISGGP